MEHLRNGIADDLRRGVCRLLADMGQAPLAEFKLSSGRRVDVMGLDAKGRFTAVEIKSGPADFRCDGKWPDYLAYCDAFYFAVGADFPRDLLPEDHGLMVADAFSAAVLRPAPARPMNGTRRRAQTIAFARTAALRAPETRAVIHTF